MSRTVFAPVDSVNENNAVGHPSDDNPTGPPPEILLEHERTLLPLPPNIALPVITQTQNKSNESAESNSERTERSCSQVSTSAVDDARVGGSSNRV